MNIHLCLPSLLHSIITIFFILIAVPASYAADDELYNECGTHLYDCGSIQGIGYPFYGDDRSITCGREGFELKCQDNNYTVIDIDTHKFRVLRIDQVRHTMRIARMDLWDTTCSETFINTTLNYSLFDYDPNARNLSLFYGCPPLVMINVTNNFTCTVKGSESTGAFYMDELFLRMVQPRNLTECYDSIKVPVHSATFEELMVGTMPLQEALNEGFDVEYNIERMACSACVNSSGICGFDSNVRQPICFCRDQPHPFMCPSKKGSKIDLRKLSIAAAAAGIGLFFTCIVIVYCTRSKFSSRKSVFFWRKRSKRDQNVEAFIRNHGSLAPKRYSYSDVKKMTNSFKDKLGQGGFGGVYKGKLHDGRLVAVKVLSTSKGNGEEFINEVASFSRTSHVNIATFLGFCFEGSKRALIYEFMPNGSLEKFIYNENPLTSSRLLGWEKLYEIAIGIARGLEYLHRGCNTRILHFDIKPHNILLDEDFCPKISDFGLAKLCPRKESIISMIETRGTIGYIAPEVFCRNFGGVSHKSDVYSYGMMVLEMVGGRKNIDVRVGHTSEIYFPHLVYKHLELNNDLGLVGVMNEEDNEIVRKMIIVGLWCIQTDPLHRPSMDKVMDMFEGSIEALQIPPKPFLSSPPRSPADSSTTSMS